MLTKLTLEKHVLFNRDTLKKIQLNSVLYLLSKCILRADFADKNNLNIFFSNIVTDTASTMIENDTDSLRLI